MTFYTLPSVHPWLGYFPEKSSFRVQCFLSVHLFGVQYLIFKVFMIINIYFYNQLLVGRYAQHIQIYDNSSGVTYCSSWAVRICCVASMIQMCSGDSGKIANFLYKIQQPTLISWLSLMITISMILELHLYTIITICRT